MLEILVSGKNTNHFENVPLDERALTAGGASVVKPALNSLVLYAYVIWTQCHDR